MAQKARVHALSVRNQGLILNSPWSFKHNISNNLRLLHQTAHNMPLYKREKIEQDNIKEPQMAHHYLN